MSEQSEQWLTMKVAATRFKVPISKISRWAKNDVIRSKANPYDKRSRLVELNELREKLAEFNAIQGINEES